MRFLVFGSRDWTDVDFLFNTLDGFHSTYKISCVVHGAAPGADSMGEQWALQTGIEIQGFPANWQLYGRRAGPIRNAEMLKHGQIERAVGFVRGSLERSRGSNDMYRKVLGAGIPNHIFIR